MWDNSRKAYRANNCLIMIHVCDYWTRLFDLTIAVVVEMFAIRKKPHNVHVHLYFLYVIRKNKSW